MQGISTGQGSAAVRAASLRCERFYFIFAGTLAGSDNYHAYSMRKIKCYFVRALVEIEFSSGVQFVEASKVKKSWRRSIVIQVRSK